MNIFGFKKKKKKVQKNAPEVDTKIENKSKSEKVEHIENNVEDKQEHKNTNISENHNTNTGVTELIIEKEKETIVEVPAEIQIDTTELEEYVLQEVDDVQEVDEIKEIEEIEYKVMDAIERIIKTDLYDLENIKFKLEVLSDAKDEEFETEEIEKLKEQLDYIIKKFEEIKAKYQNLPFDSNSELQIDDNEIYDLVNEYKKAISSEKSGNLISEVNKQLKEIEEYVSVIEILLNVENKTDDLETTLDEKLEEFQIRDDEFDKLQHEYSNIEVINKEIEAFTKEQDKIIKDLEKKIEHTETITRTIETQSEVITNFSKLIEAAIMFKIAKKIPSTPAGMIIKTGLVLGAVSALSELVQVKQTQKEVIKVSYTDYVKEIQSNISSVDSMINFIDKAQDDIEKISYKFRKECEEYKDLIPEYSKLFKNIEYMSKTLTEQKDIAVKHKDEFDKVLEKNNVKVKKLEELKNS